MPLWNRGELYRCLEDALRELDISGKSAEAARDIIKNNERAERIDRYFQRNPNATIDNYLHLVFEEFKKSGVKVRHLRERDEMTWQHYYDKLRGWVYTKLVYGYKLPPDENTKRLVEEYAGIAAEKILTSEFYYDGSFDGWARIIAHRVCSHKARKRNTLKRGKNADVGTLDDGLLEQLVGESADVDLQISLQQAIDLLKDLEQKVIRRHYYKGQEIKEIAQSLGLSTHKIYRARDNALQSLLQILNEGGHNE